MTKRQFAGGILTVFIVKHAVFVFLVVCSTSVFAGSIEQIPEEGGFSGRVNVGGGWVQVKSNTVVGSRFSNLSNDRIDSLLDDPDSETAIMPMIPWF